jgi:hypothetical protein
VLISTDYSVRVVANRTLLQLVEHGIVEHPHIFVLLTFLSDPVKSNIRQLKLVELLKDPLSSGDSDVQCSAAKTLARLADLAKYGIVGLSRMAITHAWTQTKFDRKSSSFR